MRVDCYHVIDLLQSWSGGKLLQEMPTTDYDHSVERGATYSGMARKGGGIRIRSGLNRTYYIGVAASMPAVPGMPAPVKALCIANFGMEEGSVLPIVETRIQCAEGFDGFPEKN